ncbi:hypothetical protein AnigIFM63326_009294 [Aspergillus niger]|nr:hypothetical protein AnigIFM63326_009294 [Aspergillus niger]
MTGSSRAEIIEQEPIGARMDAFRAKLAITCEDLGLPYCVNSLYNLENESSRKSISLDLVVALQALPASRVLPPVAGRQNLLSDLIILASRINANEFQFENLIPLLHAILSCEPDDRIWDKVYAAAAESTPRPHPASYFKHIPYSHSSSASPNLNDHVANIDAMLEEELGSIYTDVLGFDEAYFGAVEGSFRHQVSHAMVLLLFGGILAYGKHAGAIIIPPSLNVWAFNSHIMVMSIKRSAAAMQTKC